MMTGTGTTARKRFALTSALLAAGWLFASGRAARAADAWDEWRPGMVVDVTADRTAVSGVDDSCLRQAPPVPGETVVIVRFPVGRASLTKAAVSNEPRQWRVGESVRIEPFRCELAPLRRSN